jgi:hypothetical protein
VRSGGIIKGFATPADAARAALDRSVKSKDADSVGGETGYSDFNAFLKSYGADPNDPAHFGGEVATVPFLEKEVARLAAATAVAKAGDKYEQRKVPTLQKRHDEAQAKLKKLGGSAPAEAGSKDFKVGDKWTMKSHAPEGGNVTFEVQAQDQYAQKYKIVTTDSKGQGGVSWMDASGVSALKKVALQNPPEDGGPANAYGLKVGDTITSGAGTEYTVTKTLKDGGVAVKWGDVEAEWSAKHLDVMIKSSGAKLKSGSGPNVGDEDVAGKDLPVGAVVKVKQLTDGKYSSDILFSKTEDGKWTSGSKGGKTGQHDFDNDPKDFQLKVVSLPGQEPEKKPEPSGPKIKGMQKNTVYGGTAASLWKLDLAVGDKVQGKKGGHIYEITEITPGSIQAIGTTGKKKYLSKYATVEFVTKADGSKLKLKDLDAAPASAAPPKPAGPSMGIDSIKASLGKPAAPAPTMGSLPEGTVIETPLGQIGILKPSEPAFEGYVTAYDIKTGQKFEPPAGKAPHKVSQSPEVKKAAAAHLAKAQEGTKVTTASGTGAGTVGAGSAVKTGPPEEFNDVPAWSAALPYVPKPGQVNLTPQEKQAISGYTGSNYTSVNEALRNSESVKDLATAKKAALIKSAIGKSVVKEDVWIGRRTTLPKWKQDAKAGKVIGDNGVLSTSFNENTWSGNIHLNILVRKGANALNVKAISHHSGEDEILLPPGSLFHVLKREEKGGTTVLYVEML